MTTSEFGVQLTGRAGQQVTVQSDMQFAPVSWTAAAVGGPKAAEITLTGSRSALKDALLNWLGFGVQVTTPSGGPCWWGYVHEVALTLDGAEIVASLDRLRNRVAVTYTALQGGIETALTTEWADDLASQGQYGVKEHFESVGLCTPTVATTLRDRLLAAGAYPKLRTAGIGAGKPTATLRCRGMFARTGWRYYRRTDGRLEHTPADTVVQAIGWGVIASDQIGFADGGVHDAWGRLGALAAGAKFTVSGSDSNNATFTIGDATNEAVENYANNTIYFEATDDIFDTAAGLGFIKNDHWILIAGSTLNSGWHKVGASGADHVRTSAAVSGTIDAEATGPTITIYQAQRLDVTTAVTYEAPGAADVTISHHGQQVAQRVTLGAAMKLDRVTIEAAKVGTPTDDLQVRIMADSGGTIGSLLTSGTVAPADLSADLTSVAIPITEITLAAGNYWLLVRRTGTNDGQHYYNVGMSPASYETCHMWTGSVWTAHVPGWSLRFRLWAIEDTGALAEALLTATVQGLALSPGYLSGVNGYVTMDALAAADDELERLIAVGESAGGRVLVDISPDMVLRLTDQPAADLGSMPLMRTAGGRVQLTDAAGSPWPRGVSPAGMWVQLADIDSDLLAVGGLSPAFVEEATYNAETNAWEIVFEGERSLADMLKVQAG